MKRSNLIENLGVIAITLFAITLTAAIVLRDAGFVVVSNVVLGIAVVSFLVALVMLGIDIA